ncbi:MAG: GMC family oxidoreductase N-terminal domain-containing protein, partial [Planctomycetota bacterium]|nr:GMC family oxidoreductase N-terminal domain-containing protein [Planctomycetota bacterium]
MSNLVSNVVSKKTDTVRTEIAVLGSGPGGSITAAVLAEAGWDVLLVEEGSSLPFDPSLAFTQSEMVNKYRSGGVTAAMGPTNVAYVEGKCVGGGSEINSGLYHRTPPEVLQRWRHDYKLAGVNELDAHFAACEQDLSVSYLPGQATPASLMLRDGASQLGWDAIEVPRWHKYPAAGRTGEDSNRGRQTMSTAILPRFFDARGRLLPNTRARRLQRRDPGWTVQTIQQSPDGPQPLEIHADQVFIACGAIQTPLLLRRSGITRNVGNQLQMHPTVKVAAVFGQQVNRPGMGVPVHQVKQFAPRFSFGGSVSTPPHLALAMVDHPQAAPEVVRNWQHAAVYYAMITGSGSGSVRPIPGFDDPLVRYRLVQEDYRDLAAGLRQLCRLLLAAGAEALYCGIKGAGVIHSEADLASLPAVLTPQQANLMTIHLFSSCPMGQDKTKCAVDSFGKVHGADGL